MEIIPSVFATDKKEYKERFEIANSLSKRVHVDVMDGVFVGKRSPDLTVLHKVPGKKIEVHLMVRKPLDYLEEVRKLGVNRVYLHVDAYDTKEKLLQAIFTFKEYKIQVGLALSPQIKAETIKDYLEVIDAVLLMSINPGREGQKFLSSTFLKIRELREMTKKEIGVDGGVKKNLLDKLEKEGVNFAVVGSAIFSSGKND